MAEREAEVRDARLEVVLKALDHRGQFAPVGLDEVVTEQGGQRGRGRLVAAASARGDLRPLALRRFAPQITQPVDQAPLPQGPGKARLDGADQPWGTVRDDEERIDQAATLEVFEERGAARGVFLRARREMEQHFRPVLRNAPRTEHRFSRQSGMQASVDGTKGLVDGTSILGIDPVLASVPPPPTYSADNRRVNGIVGRATERGTRRWNGRRTGATDLGDCGVGWRAAQAPVAAAWLAFSAGTGRRRPAHEPV